MKPTKNPGIVISSLKGDKELEVSHLQTTSGLKK